MSMWSIARRPKWIGALLLALAVAGAFAALGQWQLERSIENAPIEGVETETVVPLESVAEPQGPVTTTASGQLVSTEADFVPGDYVVLSDRVDVTSTGYWVVGHAVTAGGPSLAVALGFAETADAAASAVRSLNDTPPAGPVVGRYLPSESPQQSDFEDGQRSALAVAELINLWIQAPDEVYGGYVIASDAPDGLSPIDAPAPSSEVSYNLLNIFYAAEWVIFGGFAVFLWWRLVRDEWERELEENAAVE